LISGILQSGVNPSNIAWAGFPEIEKSVGHDAQWKVVYPLNYSKFITVGIIYNFFSSRCGFWVNRRESA